jgi:hypothetical protein
MALGVALVLIIETCRFSSLRRWGGMAKKA